MLQRIRSCTAVLLAIASVILLALFSPLPHRENTMSHWLALSLYIQHPKVGSAVPIPLAPLAATGALIFHHTQKCSGSISVKAKNVGHKNKELKVVGGTGSFAFARGHAAFAQTNGENSNFDATYHIKLHLKFPNRSQIILG
ncbi:unnamed protein product [Fraxinus pennsylvanica]|uniref:Dirigent protein n=1 Tax=Fraxinus pennsylvanica TaxID=56036 RepID=A0AAD1YRA9_9LAMI|nr:unnamed protein product [Fraxinus pennsylvanica]